LLNFCFVGIRLSDQIKDDVQKAGVAEVPEIKTLTFFINALNLKPVCIIGQNGADFHSGTTNVPVAFSLVNLFTVSMTTYWF
jgi:hypothetical protein